MEPKIIFENADVLVIDKPAGLAVHADGRSARPTLADWLLEHYPDLKDVGEPFLPKPNPHNLKPILRPGIVHRLDGDTSGVMIVAKTLKSFAYLKRQFKERRVKKEYRALVYGHLKEEQGVIDTPIGKNKRDFRQRLAGPKAGGKIREALTRWQLLKRLVDDKGHKFSLLRVEPQTGRTHQIRAHLKSIGHAVTCDSLYARGRICVPPMTRQSLHASKLRLTLPDGTQRTFEAPMPDDLKQALAGLREV